MATRQGQSVMNEKDQGGTLFTPSWKTTPQALYEEKAGVSGELVPEPRMYNDPICCSHAEVKSLPNHVLCTKPLSEECAF